MLRSFPNHEPEEQLGLPQHGGAQAPRRSFGKRFGIRRDNSSGSAELEPLPRKVVHQARALGRSSMRRTWFSRFPSLCSSRLAGLLKQFVVRHAAPQEIRKPRGQLELTDSRCVPPAVVWRGVHLDPEQEMGRDKDRLQATLIPVSKLSPCASG